MPPLNGVSVYAFASCENEGSKLSASVSSSRAESLWVVVVEMQSGRVFTSQTIPNVSNYTFEIANLPNGYYEVTPYGSISGPGVAPRFVAINCISRNTGMKAFRNLEEYYTNSGLPTGNRKPNIPGDPDYIAPTQDLTMCPI